MKGKIGSLWERDDIQFTRLLAEIYAIGLTEEQKDDICRSMEIRVEQLDILLERAEKKFQHIKENLVFQTMSPWDTCQCCNHWIEPYG